MQRNMSDSYAVGPLGQSPLFAELNALVQPGQFGEWPHPAELGALLPKGVTNAAGKPLRFVRPGAVGDGALGYEARIYSRGEIATRAENWHDLFNAFMWALFPATKSRLNALHISNPRVSARRSPLRDAVTLFDECGVIVACADEALRSLHQAHDWRGLFLTQRAAWGKTIAAMVFGHGLYEQCLNPYIGLTAKAYYLSVPAAWFEAPLARRYRQADARLARDLRSRGVGMTSADLLPLPILGVPGLYTANEDPAFYRNERYFRARRDRA